MFWQTRSSPGNLKAILEKKFPGGVLTFRLAVMFCLSGLIFFAAIPHDLAENPPPPAVAPTLPPMELPEQVVKSADGASSNPNPQSRRFVAAAPTPIFPEATTSRIVFKVTAINCIPWNMEPCTVKPQLEFEATEYMKGYHIIYMTLGIGERQKRYNSSSAVLTLPQTSEKGAWVDYWAASNYKNGQSRTFRLKYRYVRSAAAPGGFRFDLLGPGWENQSPSGSMIWGVFPSLNTTLPQALMQPRSADDLYTTNRYVYLAGKLIHWGQVRVDCPDGGLYASGTATPCGEKASMAKVLEVQNKYNEKIYAAALKYNVPARVLKGILAQESQFWARSDDPYELGLGMFTENGADMTLMWNVDYYLENCLPLYGKKICASGYARLQPVSRQTMRKALLDKVGTDDEIELLAAALYANAAQVNQMVYNTSGAEPAELTDYETLWKIATGNYYAGSGCTGIALDRIVAFGSKLTWEQFVTEMDPACQLASRYVERVFSQSFDVNLCSQYEYPYVKACE